MRGESVNKRYNDDDDDNYCYYFVFDWIIHTETLRIKLEKETNLSIKQETICLKMRLKYLISKNPYAQLW